MYGPLKIGQGNKPSTSVAQPRKKTTLRSFANSNTAVPPATAWYRSDLGEFRGKQELYTRQSPQRLKALREHALIESAVSSNRIEGVSLEPSRVRDVLVSSKPLFRDRDEEEVRGYRDALTWIHQDSRQIPISNETIQRLHATTRGQIWDAGLYKEQDGDIIERYPDGTERVRFRTVPAKETPVAMARLVRDWQACLEERWVPPLIALAAFNLGFLCIHAFRDGNGRVSRLLWLLQSYQLGFEVGRYISLEGLAGRPGGFSISELEQTCPGASRDMVRRVLREQQAAGSVECQGRGPGATWVGKGVITPK